MLFAHRSLLVICLLKNRGNHMYEARIDWSTAKTYDNKSDQRKYSVERNEQQHNAYCDDTKSHSDKETIAKLHRKKSVYKSTECNPDKKQTCKSVVVPFFQRGILVNITVDKTICMIAIIKHP